MLLKINAIKNKLVIEKKEKKEQKEQVAVNW